MYKSTAETEKETKTLYLECSNPADIKPIYSELTSNTTLPDICCITISNDECAGLYWNNKLNEISLYTPYGRFFSDEEFESGAKVALLGTGYLSQFEQEKIEKIWDEEIFYNGSYFEPIGNYFFDWQKGAVPKDVYKTLAMPSHITIPLKTFFNENFCATKLRCIFSQTLTEHQRNYLNTCLKNFDDIDSLSLPKLHNEKAIKSYIEGICPYLLVFFLSLLSTANIILYWLEAGFPRYKIYLMCGARRSQIIGCAIVNISLLTFISCSCGYFIASIFAGIMPEGIISSLPWSFILSTVLFVYLFSLSIVLVKAIPVIFDNKIGG